MSKETIFTSESVSEGHPDKVADQISDAVLDAILTQDPDPQHARVACETMIKTGAVIVGGEITTNAWVDLDEVVRKVVCDIGYTSSHVGFDGSTCAVMSLIGKQSSDIAQGVNRSAPEEQGAGDQGLMFGYATNETDVLMPAAITYAHRLVQRQAEMRKTHVLPWLRPDAKSQVTLRYSDGKVVAVDAVVLSTQHDPEVDYKHLCEAVMENIIQPIIPNEWIHKGTKFHINPTGSFVIGGPVGRLRPDRAQDHRRYLRRGGPSRRRRLLRQGSVQGGPLGRLRRALCGQEHRRRRASRPLRDSGFLCHRRGRADLHLHRDLRHRQD